MPTRTHSTVVAVFRDASEAQAAARELETSGFSEDEIFINSGARTETATDAESSRPRGWNRRMVQEYLEAMMKRTALTTRKPSAADTLCLASIQLRTTLIQQRIS